MAEFGAHLTSSSAESPSIFEVLAQENLQLTLRPSVKYLLRSLARKDPPRFACLLKYFNEIYVFFDAFVQHNFLKTHGASFAEHFYGLKRISDAKLDSESKQNSTLTRNEHLKSIAYLVLIPYFKLLLDHQFEKQREQAADGIEPAKEWLRKVRCLFLYVYPWFHMLWQGIIVCYQLAYVFGKSPFHSPWIHASGTRLIMLTNRDIHPDSYWKSPSLQNMSLGSATTTLRHGLVFALTTGLSVGAFFIQFLEWWNSTHQKSVFSAGQVVPEPPKVSVNIPAANLDYSMCPLCLKQRRNDTALSTSGYVFCYTCIHRHLNQHGKCPITNYSSSTDQLIRLYPPGS